MRFEHAFRLFWVRMHVFFRIISRGRLSSVLCDIKTLLSAFDSRIWVKGKLLYHQKLNYELFKTCV